MQPLSLPFHRAPVSPHPPACLPCHAAWNQRRARVGQFPSLGTDWRTDLRIQEAGTGDPTDPHYREWTHKEIWDLITLSGRNADPRDVSMFVRNPLEIAGGWGGGWVAMLRVVAGWLAGWLAGCGSSFVGWGG